MSRGDRVSEQPERPEGTQPGGRRPAWERGMRDQDRLPTDPWTSAEVRSGRRPGAPPLAAPWPPQGGPAAGRWGGVAGLLVSILLGHSGPQRSGSWRGWRRWCPPPQSPLGVPGSCPCGNETPKVWQWRVAGSKGHSAAAGWAWGTQGGGAQGWGVGTRGGGAQGWGGVSRRRRGRWGPGSPNSQHYPKVTAAWGGEGLPLSCLPPLSPTPHPGCAGSVRGPRQAWLWAGAARLGAAPINGSLGR